MGKVCLYWGRLYFTEDEENGVMSWEYVKLEELYNVHNGLSKGGKFFGSGYPFLTFSTVFNNFFIPDELTDLVQSTEKEQKNYSVLRGDVFVTRTSETSDELGMSCVALKDYPRATFNGFTKRMRPKSEGRVLPEYIGYYMRMPSFRGEFQAFSTMTTRASLRNEDLLSLKVVLPPIETQQKIADILMTYDKLIENNQKQIKLLEEAAQRLYKEWFVDLRFPGCEKCKIVDGVPEGWRKDIIGNAIGKTVRSKQIKTSDYLKEGAIPIIDQSRNFIAGYTDDFEALVNIGCPVIVFGDHTRILKYIQFPFARGADGTQLIISNNDNIPQSLLYCGLDAIDLSNYHYARHFKYLKAETILVPTKKIAYKFDKNVAPIFLQIQKLRDIINKCAQAQTCLLPKLMRGEVKIQ